MRKMIAAACIAIASSACAGGDDAAAPTPTPTVSYAPGAAPAYQTGEGVLAPAGRARNTVDSLNNELEVHENVGY